MSHSPYSINKKSNRSYIKTYPWLEAQYLLFKAIWHIKKYFVWELLCGEEDD